VAVMSRMIRRRGDRGFTLVEVVVSMSLFAVAASVTLGLLLRTTQVAGDNIRRTAAANLAQKQIESVRSQKATAITDGQSTTTAVIGSTTYTIKQLANYVSTDSSTSVCTGSGNTLAYKLVTVTVTWPNMGTIKPIRADTLKAVGLGADGLDSTLGTLAILVAGTSGAAQSGITVTLSSGATKTTGDDGCAVFTGLSPATYSASASMSGYTGFTNSQNATLGSLGVTAGGVTRGTLTYDTVRSVSVALDSPAGAVIPSTMPLRVGDSYLSEYTLSTCPGTVTSSCTSGLPGTVQALFPEVYTVKVGACTETSPSSVSVDLRTAGTSTPSVTVPVGAPTIKVQTALGTAIVGRTVTIAHTTGCSESYTTPSVSGGRAIAIPYGSWTISTARTSAGVGTVSQSVTLSSTNKTPTVTLVVIS
jgi:prepilin-type N-terminal cleavage/methylation domain-containing protein